MRLPKSYIKQYGISKKAWREYKASLKQPKRRKTTQKKVRNLARRRRYTRKRRRRNPKTIPILPLVGLGVGMIEPVQEAMAGRFMGAVDKLAWHYLGYSTTTGQWPDFEGLKRGLVPLIIGGLAHKACGWLGINRYFANMPSPLNKLRL